MVVRNLLRNLSTAAKNASMCAEQNDCVRGGESKILHSVQCVERERIARCVADLLQLSHFGTQVCFQEKKKKTRGRKQAEGLAGFPQALPVSGTGVPRRAAAWSKNVLRPL